MFSKNLLKKIATISNNAPPPPNAPALARTPDRAPRRPVSKSDDSSKVHTFRNPWTRMGNFWSWGSKTSKGSKEEEDAGWGSGAEKGAKEEGQEGAEARHGSKSNVDAVFDVYLRYFVNYMKLKLIPVREALAFIRRLLTRIAAPVCMFFHIINGLYLLFFKLDIKTLLFGC